MSPRATLQNNHMARILIVDDHPAIREGLAVRIGDQTDLEVCGEAAGVDDALAKVKQLRPDLVIVDISLASGNGLDLVKQIKSRHAGVRMLVHSMYDESLYAERSLQAGAMGYVNKREAPDTMLMAIRQVLTDKIYLSPEMTERLLGRAAGRNANVEESPILRLSDRELEIFQLIGQGLTTGAIANQLHLSVHTIDTHREKIKAKLKLKNAAELARSAVQWTLENG